MCFVTRATTAGLTSSNHFCTNPQPKPTAKFPLAIDYIFDLRYKTFPESHFSNDFERLRGIGSAQCNLARNRASRAGCGDDSTSSSAPLWLNWPRSRYPQNPWASIWGLCTVVMQVINMKLFFSLQVSLSYCWQLLNEP